MKKSKTPPMEYLIDKLAESIQKRNPNKTITEQHKSVLWAEWQGKEQELWLFIKTLSKNEFKAENLTNKVQYLEREVEFQISVSLSGEPIIVKHVIQERLEYKKSKNQKKAPEPTIMQRVKAFISRTSF
jgi:hypothetical protein